MAAININYVMLTYYSLQFIDVPLYILYVVIYIEISNSEVFNPKDQVPPQHSPT